MRLFCVIASLYLIAAFAACRTGVPVVDNSPRSDSAQGTIAGTVSGPDESRPVEGRRVSAINIETGDRVSVRTNNAGGFSFRVAPGKYRLEVDLLPGETATRAPGPIDVGVSDVERGADFIITHAVLRPRRPDSKSTDGLGAPIA